MIGVQVTGQQCGPWQVLERRADALLSFCDLQFPFKTP